MNIKVCRSKSFSKISLKKLFLSVGWKSAEYPEILKKAMKNSSHIISAWNENQLIGIIRSMDDGCWSANIDCFVVEKSFQKNGIGTLLLTELLKDLKNVKYINVSPDEKKFISFYEKFGFKEIEGSYLQYQNL